MSIKKAKFPFNLIINGKKGHKIITTGFKSTSDTVKSGNFRLSIDEKAGLPK